VAGLRRILFLSELYKVDSSTLRAYDLARAMLARGIDIHTIASAGLTMLEKYRKAKIPLHPYHRIERLTLPYVFNGKILKMAQSMEPDIIHAGSPRLSALAARLARACRTHYVVSVNNLRDCAFGIRRSRRFAGVIAGSQFVREELVNERNVPKDAITVILPGIEIDPFSGCLSTGGAGDSDAPPVIGIIGEPDANELFLDSAAAIVQEIPDAQFLIVSDGPLNAVREKAKKLNLLKQTTLTAMHLDYRHLLKSIDALLMPSTMEGHLRLALEAMACGKPVIAAGVGENYEVIRDGENGVLVQKNDTAGLAARTVEIIRKHDLRKQLAESALEYVRNEHSLARMAKDTITFYAGVLS